MVNQPAKPVTKTSLQGELRGLLVTTHGEINQAAERIAKALDVLIVRESFENREKFILVVQQAMTVPTSKHFQYADPVVRQTIKDILEHAQVIVNTELSDLIGINQQIKEKQRELKQQIQHVEQTEARRQTPGKR